MSDNSLNELVDSYFNIFSEMSDTAKQETFKLSMIKVYQKIMTMSDDEKDNVQFFVHLLAIICSLDIKGFSEKVYYDVICELSGDILGFKQFNNVVVSFSKDKTGTAAHIKVLVALDEDTKNELFKAVGCVLSYDKKVIKEEVKEKILNFMIAVKS